MDYIKVGRDFFMNIFVNIFVCYLGVDGLLAWTIIEANILAFGRLTVSAFGFTNNQ